MPIRVLGERYMKENLFFRILKTEKKKYNIIEKGMVKNSGFLPSRNMRGIIPQEYCIEIITTIPERKNIVELID